MDTIEEWRSIVAYEGIYAVSNLGRIKSLKMKNVSSDKILNPSIDSKGYFRVDLYRNGVSLVRQVHQIVAMSFLGHVPSGHRVVVDHINGIKTDNRVFNLRLVTHRENSSICFRKDRYLLSSKLSGVSSSDRPKKWRSIIVVDGTHKHLGYYESEIEANSVYKNAIEHLKNGTFEIYYKSLAHKFSSIFKGVAWNKHARKWESYIRIGGVRKHIGNYSTEIEASEAYKNELSKIGKNE